MEQVYDALVAQLEFNIHHYDRGLVIKVSGFNHKLHVSFLHFFKNNFLGFKMNFFIECPQQLLTEAIVKKLASFEQDALEDVFAALKEQQEKAYRNYCLKPSKIVT